ncbi:MAG: protein-disulfide isomerase [Leptolyngbya foveolarum]|uniref:Protein-disulfide isomerase n=1 Tax=Leptolyngbya foveolarum TaxID=47253 RepID=A0A2W4VA25_9CYAN|nr:MAG: protein-disulfide isomerase [Leptolyngbya foveolarum]
MLTTACSNSTEQAAPAESPDPFAPTEQAAPEDEAARREAWEAQVERTRTVLGSIDRDELIGSDYTKGPKDADVVLIKFSDFECPYCAVAAANIKPFLAEHESDVLYIYKNFPLTNIHPEALPAAKAAWAAGQQDRFWLYHDGLFAFQDKLGEDYYVSLAKEMGLDMAQFERDRNSPEAQAAIDQDTKLAEALQVQGTPTFFLNEYQLPGNASPELFDQAVTELKAEIQKKPAP